MRIGVVILPQYPAHEAIRRWKSLQDRGFSHGWTYDHLAWRALADEPWYSTVTTLAVAAGATSTLTLGTWVASPNFRHPVTFAKDLMSLDDLSAGRIIAGIGAGSVGWDSTVLGQPELPPRQRVDRLTEFVELTDQLLSRRETTWRGEYFTAERARMNPAGSRERIRLVVAGNGPRSIRLASRYDGWATIGSRDTAARDDPDTWWAALAGLVRTYENARAAADAAETEGRRFLDLDSVPGMSIDDPAGFDRAADRAAALGFTDAIVHWPRARDVYIGDETSLDRIASGLTNGHWRS